MKRAAVLVLLACPFLLGWYGDEYRVHCRNIIGADGWSVLELPDDVLDDARPDLADLRLYTTRGYVGYALEGPQPKRLVFNRPEAGGVYLHYGWQEAPPPSYDTASDLAESRPTKFSKASLVSCDVPRSELPGYRPPWTWSLLVLAALMLVLAVFTSLREALVRRGLRRTRTTTVVQIPAAAEKDSPR